MTDVKSSDSSMVQDADAVTADVPKKAPGKATRGATSKTRKAESGESKKAEAAKSGTEKKTAGKTAKSPGKPTGTGSAGKNAAKATTATDGAKEKTKKATIKKTPATAKTASGKGAASPETQAEVSSAGSQAKRERPAQKNAPDAPAPLEQTTAAAPPPPPASPDDPAVGSSGKSGQKGKASAAASKAGSTAKSAAKTLAPKKSVSTQKTAAKASPAEAESKAALAAAPEGPVERAASADGNDVEEPKKRNQAETGKSASKESKSSRTSPGAKKSPAMKDSGAKSPVVAEKASSKGAPAKAAPQEQPPAKDSRESAPVPEEPVSGEDLSSEQAPAAASRPRIPLSVEELADVSLSPVALIPDFDNPDFAAFPTGFYDASPEDFFAEKEEALRPENEGEEKKRRSRGRRGRGRNKKAAAQAAGNSLAEGAAARDAEVAAETPPALLEKEDSGQDSGREEKRGTAAQDEGEQPVPSKGARRKMFVSVLPGEQVEVVITEEGQVLEYYVEMLHQAKTKGNIYKGVIHNVDPNLQAAFVNYGAVKNGFLQIDEVHPEYFVVAHEAEKGRKYPPIQKVLKPGQEVLVQVVKEPAGTKGAFLTTYLSLPGRYLVLTPGREQIGVSRKVENEKERARLRELLEGLNPGPGLGVIVRTVSMGAIKTNLQRDLQYLKRTWKEVRTRGTTEKSPCLVYQEQDLTARAVRDYLTENIGEVWVDDEPTAADVTEIAETLFPRKQNLVRVHKEENGSSLFERFNLQRQLDQIHSREVSLPSGGRLVIDATEALTAIDINSGRSGGKSNFEDMAYRTNMEAARMIPLQLRLRDIGGQVVADFIEMRDKNHWREVEKTLRNGMKVDRARYDVGKIGPFGMLEIVRQRLGSSAISVSTEPCPCCKGTGMRRNMEWQSQHALRDILRALRVAQGQNQDAVAYKTDPELALHLLNHKRRRLLEMEQAYGVRLDIQVED